MRQLGMDLEGRFVAPARVDPEQPGIANGTKGGNRQATRLGTRWGNDLAQRIFDYCFLALPGMEAGEDE